MLSKIDYEKFSVSDGVATIKVAGCGLYYDAFTFCENGDSNPGLIYVYHHVHERGQAMYCFLEEFERGLFFDLISLDKIGPTAAMKIMSSYEPMKICIDIGDGDAADLAKAKGVGKKTAEKIVDGLKEKYKKYRTKKLDNVSCISSPNFKEECLERAEKALVKLGYKCRDVRSVLRKFAWVESQGYVSANQLSPGADPYNADSFVKHVVTYGLRELHNK